MYRTTFDSEQKVWSGDELIIKFDQNTSVGEAVLWSLEKNPQIIAQVSTGEYELYIDELVCVLFCGRSAMKTASNTQMQIFV